MRRPLMRLPPIDAGCIHATWHRLHLIGDFRVALRQQHTRRTLIMLTHTLDILDAMRIGLGWKNKGPILTSRSQSQFPSADRRV